MRRDLHDWILPSQNINTQLINTTANVVGAIVDTQGYNILEFLIAATTITTGVFTPLLEWGNAANLSDAVTVDAAHILGSIADATFLAADDNEVKKIGVYLTTYRYVRLTIVPSATPNGTLGAIAVQAAPALMPTAD